MRTGRPRFVVASVLTLVAAWSASVGTVRAESHEASAVTLGWQTENADEIVVATLVGDAADAASGDRSADFRVGQVVKGDVAPGALLHVTHAGRTPVLPWRVGTPHLLFLRRGPAAAGVVPEFAPLSGAFSMRPLDPGSAETRFPALVATLGEVLDSKDAPALRSLLLTWMEDADPGVVWSAATDFVRHVELHDGLPPQDGARIVAAFRRQPIGKNSKDALALAAAETRTPEAVRALVESLLLPDGARIRGSVAEALRRMSAPPAEPSLVASLADANPAQKCALLGALGVVGGAASAQAVKALVSDDDGAVRIEAAAALGGIARNVRAKNADARVGAADVLAARVTGKTAETVCENEARAVVWALAQLDEPPAFDVLRKLAAESPRESTRAYAARMLARPRQSLILHP